MVNASRLAENTACSPALQQVYAGW